MYTCCPICKTNFNVTEAQLQVAQGKVRCGSCKNVFNARQHINYRPLSSKQTPPKNTRGNTEANPGQKTIQHSTASVPAKEKITPHHIINDSNKNTTLKQKAEIQPEVVVTQEKESTEHININAIFNALETQLSQGTYIDISKPAEIDIREAAFDDIFDDDDDILTDSKEPSLIESPNETRISETKISETGIADKIDYDPLQSTYSNSDEEIDLNLYEQDDNSPLDESSDKIVKPLNHINSQNLSEDNRQQHAFDFIALPDEPDLSFEDKEQLAAVDKPLNINPEDNDKQQADRKALHQAIDNIIKVDNNIPTPFEENDADHFVIEVESEPDVELVDEDDLDKLFASTDSLRISDLKFDKYKTTREREEQILAVITDKIKPDKIKQDKIKTEVEPIPEPDLTLEPEENETNSFHNQVEDNTNPENFATDSFLSDDYDAEDFNPDNISINTELETEFDNPSFEEEIILGSAEIEEPIPHRLRDAVASLEQQPLSRQKRLLYSVAIFILIGLLGIQLILFKSPAIANMLPALQPLLVSICKNLPCRYTGSHNKKQIKIINRDVRLHPKIKGALLISATINNQANYTQPYPTILLKFTDLTGATVAQRHFQPSEYLGLLNKPFAMMPSNKPVQLNIEILDPGSDAINFQFFFL